MSGHSSAAVIAVSLKMYFGHERTMAYVADVAARVEGLQAVISGAVRVAVLPGFLSIPGAADQLRDTRVMLGAQDLCQSDVGAFTGEVSGRDLVRFGVSVVEVGHAERRILYREDDAMVAAKVLAATRNGLIPLLCVGEPERTSATDAARVCVEQLRSGLGEARPRELWVAYEPHWAIGAPEPAPVDHVATVCQELRAACTREGIPAAILYGGSAGPGLSDQLGFSVDGLFLGRFAHDPARLECVVRERAALLAPAAHR